MVGEAGDPAVGVYGQGEDHRRTASAGVDGGVDRHLGRAHHAEKDQGREARLGQEEVELIGRHLGQEVGGEVLLDGRDRDGQALRRLEEPAELSPGGVSGMEVDAGSAVGGGADRASAVPAAVRVRARHIASSVLARARRCVRRPSRVSKCRLIGDEQSLISRSCRSDECSIFFGCTSSDVATWNAVAARTEPRWWRRPPPRRTLVRRVADCPADEQAPFRARASCGAGAGTGRSSPRSD